MAEKGKQWQALPFGAPKSLQMIAAIKVRRLLLGQKLCQIQKAYEKAQISLCQQRSLKSKVFSVVMVFFSSHVQMWELNHKEGSELKNWCSWTVVLEKTHDSPLDSSPKGNQPWIFIGRTDAEAETPILWPPDAKNWLIGKDPDVGKDWRQEEKGMTEDEMVGWHHRLNGHEFG